VNIETNKRMKILKEQIWKVCTRQIGMKILKEQIWKVCTRQIGIHVSVVNTVSLVCVLRVTLHL
jgi:hypothetical protein